MYVFRKRMKLEDETTNTTAMSSAGQNSVANNKSLLSTMGPTSELYMPYFGIQCNWDEMLQ